MMIGECILLMGPCVVRHGLRGLECLRRVCVCQVAVDILNRLGHGIRNVVRLTVGTEENRISLGRMTEE